MPLTYDKMGLCFQYPDNWTLDEQDALENQNSVSIYSPGGSFWSVMIYPPSEDPEKLAEQALSAMRETFDDLESSPVEQCIDELTLRGYELNFYCLDLTNVAIIFGIRQKDRTLLFHIQAEDRDYETNRNVFLAITTSLLRD